MTILKDGFPYYPEVPIYDCIKTIYARSEDIKTKTSMNICFISTENGVRAYNTDVIEAFLSSNHLDFDSSIKIDEHGYLCALDRDNNLAMFMMPLKIT